MKATIVYNDSDTNPTTVEVDVLAISTGKTGDHYITVTEDGWNTDLVNFADIDSVNFHD